MIMDKKALKILKDYDILSPESTSPADFEYAKKMGVMFDPEKQNHDDSVDNMFDAYKKLSKTNITNAFLASMSSCSLEYRAGLPVYAIMQKFPYHHFEGFDRNPAYCKHCGSPPNYKVDLSFENHCRFFGGGIVSYDVYGFAFYLKQAGNIKDVYPSNEDFRIFLEILSLINNAEPKDTPNILVKKIRKIPGFKSKEGERRALLETLGYCSIMEGTKHKGFLTHYTILGLAPRKSHSSFWGYPVDWWVGENKLNKEALRFWFGEYEELRDFIERLT